MDCNSKTVPSYQIDQDILDARGISITVEEVAGLPTTRYTERVQLMRLKDDDLAFLKSLRRRIKNRLASQNSRRRSMENLRRLTRELCAVRVCKGDAMQERNALLEQRCRLIEQCHKLQCHLRQKLRDRNDDTELPSIDVSSTISRVSSVSPTEEVLKRISVTETKSPLISECFLDKEQRNGVFECRIDKLVHQSVNHIFKSRFQDEKKIVCAKTVFISNQDVASKDVPQNIFRSKQNGCIVHTSQVKNGELEPGQVLNLSVKENERRNHGRKQSAPRRITYVCNEPEDCILDLKIKKENQ